MGGGYTVSIVVSGAGELKGCGLSVEWPRAAAAIVSIGSQNIAGRMTGGELVVDKIQRPAGIRPASTRIGARTPTARHRARRLRTVRGLPPDRADRWG